MTNLQEKSMRYCIGDEVWRWKSGMIKELKARHHDRWNRKTLLVSQGWDAGHEADAEWDSGTREVWGWTCSQKIGILSEKRPYFSHTWFFSREART